jgi:hypothetical protein
MHGYFSRHFQSCRFVSIWNNRIHWKKNVWAGFRRIWADPRPAGPTRGCDQRLAKKSECFKNRATGSRPSYWLPVLDGGDRCSPWRWLEVNGRMQRECSALERLGTVSCPCRGGSGHRLGWRSVMATRGGGQRRAQLDGSDGPRKEIERGLSFRR